MSANPALHSASSSPRVIVNPAYRWKSDGDFHYVGYAYAAGEALAQLDGNLTPSIYTEHVLRTLFEQKEFGSGILTLGRKTIAWVDHIRAYPVFYSLTQNGTIVSNDARSIRAQLGNIKPSELCTLEFAMAGYVTGQETLYDDIKCLLPGEVLIAEEGLKPVVTRYYRYTPVPDHTKGRREAREELSGIMDVIVQKIIVRANGRPIWIPLSAGLDSRIILCKLHEHGYKNLHTFTYGPRFNFEALHAKNIAKKLNVPWQFVALNKQECAAIYADKTRRAYSNFADGLKAIADFREYSAIKTLKDKKVLPADAILINGQSGDYITGGHVNSVWFEKNFANFNTLADVLIAKHYDLWKGLKTSENITAIKARIGGTVPEAQRDHSPLEFAALEECWEYDGRQATLVVNGQRVYDFFGYDWEMPLWERTLCDFYANVPYEQKRGQVLYKEYLKAYNYQGLFPSREPHIWRWPLPMLWVLPVAHIIGLFSKLKKMEFYALMRYYGHYSNQYAFIPFEIHKTTCGQARNVVSLFVRDWFADNRIPLAQNIKSVLSLK